MFVCCTVRYTYNMLLSIDFSLPLFSVSTVDLERLGTAILDHDSEKYAMPDRPTVVFT